METGGNFSRVSFEASNGDRKLSVDTVKSNMSSGQSLYVSAVISADNLITDILMRGAELPHRRYSMPEAIMRKFRLGQSSPSSSDNSSRSSNRSKRHHHVPRRKQQKPKRPKPTTTQMDRSCQTSSRPLLETPLSCSVPDLSSSEGEGRPISGTPSPGYRVCYGAEHSCTLCSTSWSVASSDCTLNQTVSDRTTSTQDSTLSVKSSTPNTPTPLPFTQEELSALEDDMFRPVGRFIAVHSESVLVRPIQIVESIDNWHFGFAADDFESLPRDRSTSIDQSLVRVWDQTSTVTIEPRRRDCSTSIDRDDVSTLFQPNPKVIDHIERNTVTTIHGSKPTFNQSCHQTTTNDFIFGPQNNERMTLDSRPKIDCDTNERPLLTTHDQGPKVTFAPMRGTNVNVGYGQTELTKCDQRRDFSTAMQLKFDPDLEFDTDLNIPQRDCGILSTTAEIGTQMSTNDDFCRTSKNKKTQFSPKCQNTAKNGDLSVSGGNYKENVDNYGAIVRYSAVPRSNSMIVNPSSSIDDDESDSDLSLTDSLEDGNDNRVERPSNRHDDRPVRGEVSKIEEERRRLPKSERAFAYFLSSTGEQGAIAEWAIPDWLRARLRRREEDLKQLRQFKTGGKRQTIVCRRRRKTMRRVVVVDDRNSSLSPPIKWAPSGETSTIVGVVRPIPETSTIDQNDRRPDDLPNCLKISEVIKIEMSNQLKTVITKEKSINLNRDALLCDSKNVQSSEIINNQDANCSQKIILRTLVGRGDSTIDTKIDDVDVSTQTNERPVVHSLFGRRENDKSYSFKQFRPLFRSKADDQTVADVLLEALKEDQGKVDNSSNTKEPFVSESCQTTIDDGLSTLDKSEQCDDGFLTGTEIVSTDDKQCNTDVYNVDDAPIVELDADQTTLVSQLAVDKSTATVDNVDKSVNTVNPLTDSFVQTEPKIEPVKKDVHFVDEIRQSTKLRCDKTSRSKRDVAQKSCSRDNANPDILELNVPPCSCHACALRKKTRSAPLKKTTKFPTSRRGGGVASKFHRKFEAIPEEKSGSLEEVSKTTTTTTTTGTMTRGELKDASAQEPSPPPVVLDDKVDDSTQTTVQNADSLATASNNMNSLVVGRFKAISDKEDEDDDSSSGGFTRMMKGLDVVRQYKGRAALATNSPATGHEELLTLSKGWINFYLLKDNHDLEEAPDEGFRLNAANIDETIHQYTLEIQATPEPVFHPSIEQSRDGSRVRNNVSALPNLTTRGVVKKRHKSSQVTAASRKSQVTALPEIYSSSSTSTPEDHRDPPRASRKMPRPPFPELNEIRGSKHEIKARREKRERITSISQSERQPEIDRTLEAHSSHSARAVEVARSEHSVSSITSSTVILSESPSPQQLRYSAQNVQKRTAMFTEHKAIGSSWTVTVAGSTGVTNQTPPDVEMRLSFAKPPPGIGEKTEPKSVFHYNSKQTHHVSRAKRQDQMIEEYKHSLHNERHSVQYVPEPRSIKKERGRLDVNRKTPNDDDFSGRLSPKSKCSEAYSEEGELQVTGSAITPELKPRVPTQSERDLVRRQRYKFTR